MISLIKQFKTHNINTYTKEIVLQQSLCLYKHQSYSYSPKPRTVTLAHRQQSINEALFLLPVPPHSGHGLFVVGRVPVGVEHDEAVGPDEVQAAAPGLAGQHEDELGTGRVVELIEIE